MSRRKRADPLPPPPRPDGITVREHLRRLGMDPEYLAVREALGEPLSPADREVLDARRSLARAPAGPGGGR